MDATPVVADEADPASSIDSLTSFDAVASDPAMMAIVWGVALDEDAEHPPVLPVAVAMPANPEVLYEKDRHERRRPVALRPENDPALNAVDDALAVRQFVRGLPPLEREVVFRTFWMNQSTTEIGLALGVHRTTAARALERALEAGREVLGSGASPFVQHIAA
jgi:DNA-directed RNA polymerase specialized sigma24 family protein